MTGDGSKEQYAMRSRAARTSSDGAIRNDSPNYRDVVIIERKVKNGDTLNNIAIKYQVNVADIKRVNNMVSEQDFLALSKVKIPLSRMRMALGVRNSSSHEDEDDDHIIDFNDRTHLLHDESRSRDPSVEDIFHKTDTAIAAVRETLPEDGVIPGSFHFVDARPPDSGSYSVWVVIFAVLLIFCVLPLVLTFYEEREEAAHPHHPHHVPT